MSVKAIETKYRGYRFRSRLEARWAVFFDAMVMDWDYEPEGYEIPSLGRYLPDFFIRMTADYQGSYPEASGYWIEVKPGKPTALEIKKLQYVCRETKHHGLFLIGTPGHNPPIAVDNSRPKPKTLSWRHKYLIGTQLDCCTPHEGCSEHTDRAINAARSARFEFGEQGGVA